MLINSAVLSGVAKIPVTSQPFGPTAQRFAALCTGSFFLAEAGLLDRRRAATHWNYAPLLQQRFPALQVDADAIFVQDVVSGPRLG